MSFKYKTDKERKEAYKRQLERKKLNRDKIKEDARLELERKKDDLWNRYCSFKEKGMLDVFYCIILKVPLTEVKDFINL